ncbi:serine carboxypeptidase S28 [Nitzschia inconspicua]|uniref:Serine carboxypeptidase S28 n=1 Tax=Nitzschia inconspicua TaxID=303405 RepID=A0A9K3L4X0_9STRA|nr:serine carboxypeptidase S28 [Nitzschia inconspicua]
MKSMVLVLLLGAPLLRAITEREQNVPIDSDGIDNIEGGSHLRYSIDNLTCGFFDQPLNHFVPRGKSPSYQERYCVYDGFVPKLEDEVQLLQEANRNRKPPPIFFYTGNESPLEQYINQTGLMWELAPKYNARVVFVEHRYEGLSLPNNLSQDCMSYASTIQALADYARILEIQFNPGNNKAPVIVFGGSYGGMLSAWMRMKYPHLVAGAISASAPLGAFPQIANDKIDSSARVLAAGLSLPYPPTAAENMDRVKERALKGLHNGQEKRKLDRQPVKQQQNYNHCPNNLLAAWPLVSWLAQRDTDGTFLQQMFSLCDPLPDKDAAPLLEWAQGIWFDLAEGSFPYPSSYIPFALLHQKVNLPAWPMQAACWRNSRLYKDWGVTFSGDLHDVRFEINYGDSNITLSIDWDQVREVGNTTSLLEAQSSNDVIGLLTSVRDAVSIWYNITKQVSCYNVSEVAPNHRFHKRKFKAQDSGSLRSDLHGRFSPALECYKEMKRSGSWGPLCCNDEMNLVITEARGVGNDFFWPPSVPRGVRTYAEMIQNVTPIPCPDPYGIFGYSKEPYDPWSTRLHTHFGGISMTGHSNILFSNGLLDPWSAGGVYKSNLLLPNDGVFQGLHKDKALVQNITGNDVVSLIIPFGGHHTDLMYSNSSDPVCVTEAREIEERYIAKWIHEWEN